MSNRRVAEDDTAIIVPDLEQHRLPVPSFKLDSSATAVHSLCVNVKPGYHRYIRSIPNTVIENSCEFCTLPQIGVNPTSLELLVFQHFWSFVTKIRSPMLANKFYKGGIFVNCLDFCCSIIYHSHSLIHQRIIAVPHKIIFFTKCDQDKNFCKPRFAW